MSRREPDFDALVGAGLELGERERLLRVHELLVEAGPPPEPERRGPAVGTRSRSRRWVALALAAALAVGVFAFGAFVGNRIGNENVDFVVAMSGTGAAPDATASLTVFEIDSAGNWPMKLEVRGLAGAQSGRPYELWLTKAGVLEALCGTFRTDPAGFADVPMNAPYKLKDFDDWVIVEEGSKTPLLTT